MAKWRFDQGRLDYFQIDEIKRIATALAELDGAQKPGHGQHDTVRAVMGVYSPLPFLPGHYYVWRNYGRVFECMLLATSIKDHIIATDLCRKIAADPDDMDPDDYLGHFARNFYYPSPIFEEYDPTSPKVFPVLAIIKFLFAEWLYKRKDYLTVDEIGCFLISNNVTGLEDLEFYSRLKRGKLPLEAELRQTRELVKVISQFSFLKWENPRLVLESISNEELFQIGSSLTANQRIPRGDRGEEILEMGSLANATNTGAITLSHVDSIEPEFTEGQKVRATHLRAERSAQLKKFYFQSVANPHLCRMCGLDTAKKYPWVPYVIELHHLLPLGSPVRVEVGTTSIKDIVGICPTCHRATHRYYSRWLNANKRNDFSSYGEATLVYKEAKALVVAG